MTIPRLIVSDIDGTLVTSSERISPRTVAAIAALRRRGVEFILASGRPARWMLPVVEQLPLGMRPVCVCSNGAVIYDSARDRVIHTEALAPAVLSRVISTVGEALPHVGFGVERSGKSAYDQAESLFAVSDSYDHAWESDEHGVETLAELAGQPAVKLLIRDPAQASETLYRQVAPILDSSLATATFSWDGGLVEISAPGVSKRTGLQWVASNAIAGGVEAEGAGGVVAFGDMPNDLDMFDWAGYSVAMGNAHPAVKAAAAEVTMSNDDDGVARVLERWGSAD